MDNKHLATIFQGDGITPAPYQTSIRKEVALLNAVEAMSRVVKTIPTNPADTNLYVQCLTALRDQLSAQQDHSRRLEHEYNDRFSH